MKYLFAIMDDESRFWIAQQVGDNKGTTDVRPMFKHAKRLAGKMPRTLISDGAYNFHVAFKKEFGLFYGAHKAPVHVREITMEGKIHNNKMERLNGEIRDREKVMRGVKKSDSPATAFTTTS